MKNIPSSVAVIGDLVSSRRHDRAKLQSHLSNAIAEPTIHVPDTIQPLHPTVGDEIQGVFPTLGSALRATHLVRLALRPYSADIRFGIGVGAISHIDKDRDIQDGPGWWAARAAIDDTSAKEQHPGYDGIRTGIFSADNTTEPSPTPPLVTNLFHLIDTHVSALRPATCTTLRGLILEHPNSQTAAELGISASANSQRANGNGLKPLADVIRATWELTAFDPPIAQKEAPHAH